MQQFNRREKFLVSNTLSCVPLLLQGHAVLIDLLNEVTVAGRISNADGLMNVHLENAVLIHRDGKQQLFQEFMVPARLIRQMHIPAYVDMEQEVQNYMQHGRRQKFTTEKRQKRTFKQKRAEERHKEIVQDIIKSKSEDFKKEV